MLRVRYDLNGDGVISFDEFLGMLAEDPWARLLPPGTVGRLMHARY